MKVGVQVMVPVALLGPTVKVALLPGGRPAKFAVSPLSGCPSGSEARTVRMKGEPAPARDSAGADSTGARSTFPSRIEDWIEPVSAFEAEKDTTYGPGASSKPGIHTSVPEVLPGSGVKTAPLPAGKPLRLAPIEAIAWPSGSNAVTWITTGVPSVPFTVAGAVTTGGASTS